MLNGSQIATSLQADIGLRPDIRYIAGGSIDYAHYDALARRHRAAGFIGAGRVVKLFALHIVRFVGGRTADADRPGASAECHGPFEAEQRPVGVETQRAAMPFAILSRAA